MVRLEEITNRNIVDAIQLTVHDHQKTYVADNSVSLAEA